MGNFINAEDYCLSVKDGTHNSPKKVDQGIRLVTSKNIIGGKLDLETAYFISNEDAMEVDKRSKVDVNDVLISMIGTVGEVCLIKDNPNFVIKNVGLFKNAEPFKAKWLYFYLRSKQAQDLIRDRLKGTTQQYISLGDLRKLPILTPKNDEHLKSVVSILENLDNKIQLNTQTNQTLEAIAQAIFKSWFIDFDPVRAKAQAIDEGKTTREANLAAMAVISGKAIETLNDTEFKQLWEIADAFPSELVESEEFGEVPKGWEVKNLGSIAQFIKGKKPKSVYKTQEEGMLPHILVASLNGKYHEFTTAEKTIVCNDKDTLILMDGSGSGKISIGHHGIVGSTLAKIALTDEKYWAIIHLFLKNKELDIQQHTTGTSIPHTDKKRVLNYQCAIPCETILNWLNIFFEQILMLVLNKRNESLSLEKTRDLLSPKLLNGEI